MDRKKEELEEIDEDDDVNWENGIAPEEDDGYDDGSDGYDGELSYPMMD